MLCTHAPLRRPLARCSSGAIEVVRLQKIALAIAQPVPALTAPFAIGQSISKRLAARYEPIPPTRCRLVPLPVSATTLPDSRSRA